MAASPTGQRHSEGVMRPGGEAKSAPHLPSPTTATMWQDPELGAWLSRTLGGGAYTASYPTLFSLGPRPTHNNPLTEVEEGQAGGWGGGGSSQRQRTEEEQASRGMTGS